MTTRYGSVGIGLGPFFSRLDALQLAAANNYPPHNCVYVEDDVFELEIALAGWSREEIEVVTERNVLTVSGRKNKTDDRTYDHKGISSRDFARNWQLVDGVIVDGVKYKDGLLVIRLTRIIPDAQRRIDWDVN